MKTKKPKNESCKQWAYFAPDGNIQVRSIAATKKLSRQYICYWESVDYKDYEKAGYVLKRIWLQVTVY